MLCLLLSLHPMLHSLPNESIQSLLHFPFSTHTLSLYQFWKQTNQPSPSSWVDLPTTELHHQTLSFLEPPKASPPTMSPMCLSAARSANPSFQLVPASILHLRHRTLHLPSLRCLPRLAGCRISKPSQGFRAVCRREVRDGKLGI